jgi:tRNA-dihydrouridine synthase B
MLAPMQGITNRALRSLFAEWVRPDVVFTEFVRVWPGPSPISRADEREMASRGAEPLVVQLIGSDPVRLVAGALAARRAGVAHLNLNLGCPSGRHAARSAGGALLKSASRLPELLRRLRGAFDGSLSVKVRAGYDDPRQIFNLLPMFEAASVDFVVLHPRTVVQAFAGRADHEITAAAVRRTRLPVIANGDITTTAEGQRVLQLTGAAGLMLGRGALADPVLFERLRGHAAAVPDAAEQARVLRGLLEGLLPRFRALFCGDCQVLAKLREPLAFVTSPALQPVVVRLRRAKSLAVFGEVLAAIGSTSTERMSGHSPASSRGIPTAPRSAWASGSSSDSREEPAPRRPAASPSRRARLARTRIAPSPSRGRRPSPGE